jgi:glyoxylate utilization-related uncharacterized protein
MNRLNCLVILFMLTIIGCASHEPPRLPYPAFMQTEELPDMFIAAMPGVRAKPLAGDMRTRTSSSLITLPPDWKGTTGGAPGKSVELFVLAGEVMMSDFELKPGSYAYVPPGSLGFGLATDKGAQLLYFLDDIDESAVIRSPMIMNTALLEWEETAAGRSVRELRSDPGSGSKTWLLRIAPGSSSEWFSSSSVREGFMLSGEFQDSECFNGEAQTWQYSPGGYFLRPPDTYSGGPEAIATTETIWFIREQSAGSELTSDVCFYEPPPVEEAPPSFN